MSDLPNLKSLDLNLLIVFDAVYTARSISRAAERLGMTQGAVSNALGRLRDRVGDPLFARSQHGVSPTLKAAQMVGPIREALATIDRQLADAPFDLQHYRRHFRIMIGDLFEPIMLPPLLREIATAAPHVTVESASHLRQDIVKALRSGSTDLAAFLYPIDAPDMHVEPLCRIEHLVVARRGHPEIGETLDAETFARLGHVVLEADLRDRLAIEQNLLSEGIARKRPCVVNRVWSMPAIVERSDLVAILPDWFVREIAGNFDLVSYKLPVPIPQQNLYLTWLARHADDPGHHWLRTTLIEAFRAHLRASLPGASDPVQGAVVGVPVEESSLQPSRGNARE